MFDRLGGDEFVVILEDLDFGETDVMQAERVVLQLQARLRQSYALTVSATARPSTHHCSSSIGLALFQDDSLTSEELLRRADTAMYQAKAAGRNSVRFFDPAMQAVVRWIHPQKGLVPLGDFIPVAEETSLIIALGHWVLATACQQLAQWAHNPATRHLTLSVNVSARQFHQPAFIEEPGQLLQETGAPSQRLKLELTESLLPPLSRLSLRPPRADRTV